jgi:murein DD-endopeptidase MepM/ murein hydrolase activator NlpD
VARAAVALFAAGALLLAAGCTPLRPRPSGGGYSGGPTSSGGGDGVYHTVRRGETLWRISKTYGVSLNEVMEANDLENYDIGVGQKLYIPGASRVLAIKLPDGSTSGDTTPVNIGDVKLKWPLAGRGRSSVTSRFGPRKSPGAGGSTFHKGIDIDGVREERVLASAAGEIVFAGRMSGFGNVVMIDHGGRLITVYGHLSRYIVRLEDTVGQGQTIGYVGSTGAATGSHLHFEVRHKGVSVDPLKYLP